MKSFVGGLLLPLGLAASFASAQAPADGGAQRVAIAIVGQPDRQYDTLQAALDAAPPEATIRVGEGRCEERVKITRPVKIIGAGADKTVLGPTLAGQVALREKAEKIAAEIDATSRAAEQARPRRELTPAETAELRQKYEAVKRLFDQYLQPVVLIDGATDVRIRSLRVTMPDTPHEGEGLQVTGAVTVKGGGVLLTDCAIVGCLSSGLASEGASRVELRESLVAACWGTGVSMPYAVGARCRIADCDIRNNYHYNISVGGDECVIRDSRISGTAWSGVSCGSANAVIERNAIFDNNRAIYSAGPHGVVKHNLIYRNVGGASCWSEEASAYESNVFLENRGGAIYVHGPGKPNIRRNAIVGGEYAICYGPQGATQGDLPPAEVHQFSDNVVWNVATPMARVESKASPEPQALPLNAADGNRVADPRIRVVEELKLVLGDEAVVRELGLEPLAGLTLASRWPITDEERAMIPDDGTRDSEKWKMRPKRVSPY